jgi:quercetin dioxygenase-like cupin family protein
VREPGRVIRSNHFRWQGARVQEYKTDSASFEGVVRQVLLGGAADDRSLNFELRYFEIASGGYTTLERHRHAHAVVVLRGRGSVILDSSVTPIQPHDCVYVAPEVVHQFRADRGEALGFLCVVDRVRDRARAVAPTRP